MTLLSTRATISTGRGKYWYVGELFDGDEFQHPPFQNSVQEFIWNLPDAGMWLQIGEISFSKVSATRLDTSKPRRRQYSMAEWTGCRVSVPPPCRRTRSCDQKLATKKQTSKLEAPCRGKALTPETFYTRSL